MAYLDLMAPLHRQTSRDYLGRVNAFPKAEAARRAKDWGYDYWDGDRRIGYGGYKYLPGRWTPVAEQLIAHYDLKAGDTVLDVGCGKGFLLFELLQLEPGLKVRGLDISSYAIEHAKAEIKPLLDEGGADALPYDDAAFKLAISINTLHNLPARKLDRALRELSRVSRQQYLCVESFRNEEEKVNLLYWQVTCEAFYSPDDWAWWFEQTGYTGDHSFIYFE
jgi:SAM-dependent methyltransferase